MTATPTTQRQEIFARLSNAYADLGWALPTSIEYSLSLMLECLTMAEATLAARAEHAARRTLSLESSMAVRGL